MSLAMLVVGAVVYWASWRRTGRPFLLGRDLPPPRVATIDNTLLAFAFHGAKARKPGRPS